MQKHVCERVCEREGETERKKVTEEDREQTQREKCDRTKELDKIFK